MLPYTPPRRINIGSSSDSPLLPLSHGSSSASPHSRNIRSTTRRISYTLKNRAHRYAYPLGLSAIVALIFLYYTYSHSAALTPYHPHTNRGKLHLYTRDDEDANGISLLTQDTEELIAEDDLFWQSYVEPPTLTKAEKVEADEMKAHKLDVELHNRQSALESLVWWLAEGGILPRGFEVPSKKALLGGKGREMERILDQVQSEGEEPGESIFQEGWAEYAKKQYRIVVFSKSYCPFSKRAKKILETYRLTPAPFIIEIDRRTDMDQLQTLLQRLTGRRTVPNLLLDFESIGGADEVTLLHGEGGLQRKFQEMGMLPGFRYNFSPNSPNRGGNIRKDPVINNNIKAQDPVVPQQPPYPPQQQQIPPHAQPVAPQVQPVLPQQPPPGREEQAVDHDDIAQRHGPAGPAVERVELDREAVANRHADDGSAPAQDDKVYAARDDHHLDLAGVVKDAHERVDFVHGMGKYENFVPLDDASDEELYIAADAKVKRAHIPEPVVQDMSTDSDLEESAQLEKLRTRLGELEALAAGRIDRVSSGKAQAPVAALEQVHTVKTEDELDDVQHGRFKAAAPPAKEAKKNGVDALVAAARGKARRGAGRGKVVG